MAALIGFAASTALELHGQGTVNFANNTTSYVYDETSGTPVLAAAGTTFSVALYWAPVDPLNPTVQPAPSAFTQQGASTYVGMLVNGTYRQPGIYSGGTILIPGITPPGGLAWFQVKAWETACGSTYEQAYNRQGDTVLGLSGFIVVRTGDPTTGGSPALLTGIGPIYISGPVGGTFGDPCVPEPSAVLLGLLGAIVVFGLGRNKRSG